MAREKSIYRVCEECGVNKRTTVYPYEEAQYFCEPCLKTAGAIELKKGDLRGIESFEEKRMNPIIGPIILIIIFVVGFVIGSWLF